MPVRDGGLGLFNPVVRARDCLLAESRASTEGLTDSLLANEPLLLVAEYSKGARSTRQQLQKALRATAQESTSNGLAEVMSVAAQRHHSHAKENGGWLMAVPHGLNGT